MGNNSTEWLGKQFGRLTIIDFAHATPPYRGWWWVCKCECGNTRTLIPGDVKQGKICSCGCWHDEVCANKATKFKHSINVHKRLYSIYNGIKKRCYNQNEPRYKDYGYRGIRMCEEWLDSRNGFDSFVEWSLSHQYNDDMSIDRIDVNGDYSPTNCRWIPMSEQALNKRETKWVVYKGERVQLRVLCKRLGLTYDMIHNRIFSLNWSVEDAIERPSAQADSLMRKCREKGINYCTVRDRITKFGWSEERALNTPTVGRGANSKTYK